MKRIFSFLIAVLVSSVGFAQIRPEKSDLKAHDSTSAERASIPQRQGQLETTAAPAWSPVHDTADFKYVLLSSVSYNEDTDNLRYTIAKNLPEGVKLVLLARPSDVATLKSEYSKYISLDRVIFVASNNTTNSFWARDAFPVPVKDAVGKLSLVQARYYRPFSGGPDIAESLNLASQSFNFTFVGGNIIADEEGNCFTVDSRRLYTMNPDTDLVNAYGCKTKQLMKHVAGIGDVDEVLKPIGNRTMLTNQPSYVDTLKSLGYNVVMLPSASGGSYRTYANSLIVGKTVFMPSYGVATDESAQKVYDNLGYTVFKIPSNWLSDELQGSIHCQTMAYPAIPEQQLLEMLNLTRIH